MLQRGTRYLPDLPQWPALRAWTGQRPCTPDNLPYIGRLQRDASLWLAAGHEGLGITTATGTADVLADLLCDQEPAIDTRAFAPDRKMLTSAAA
jgi:glycine/D-amino acid oxidase-like deaminating enzyme